MEVEGARLRYSLEGRGLSVLVPGSSVYYPRTFSERLRKSCRFTFLDLRHFAEQEPETRSATVGIDACANDIEHACTVLGLDRVVLLGHSHHGNLALEYARRYPGRVSHLVLIGSPPCNVQETHAGAQLHWDRQASEARRAALRKNHQALECRASDAMSPAESFVAQYVADGPKYWYDYTYDAAQLWEDVPINPDSLASFRGFFRGYEFPLHTHELGIPVLAIMGRHDYAVPHTLWEKVLPHLPGVSYRLLEHSGHTPQLEEPETFDAVLLDWLRGGSE